MSPQIGVLGAGSWGTTLANLLADIGADVCLWAYEAEVVEAVASKHENTMYLPGCHLAARLQVTGDVHDVVRDAQFLVVATPSHATRHVLARAAPGLGNNTVVVCATKGIEASTLGFMSTVAAEVIPGRPFVTLSGPSFAREVFERQPTAVVAASRDAKAARQVQELFSTSAFRVYTSGDVIGTEVGGSLKNAIAIAAGILEGLGLGNNPRAALITRGLAEITRLGVVLGADPASFAGLAGLGDLILTTCGALSRNRALGVALAKGETLEGYRRAHRTVAEGVITADAASRLAQQHGIELPSTESVREVLYDGKAPREAITNLMSRSLRPERDQ